MKTISSKEYLLLTIGASVFYIWTWLPLFSDRLFNLIDEYFVDIILEASFFLLIIIPPLLFTYGIFLLIKSIKIGEWSKLIGIGLLINILLTIFSLYLLDGIFVDLY